MESGNFSSELALGRGTYWGFSSVRFYFGRAKNWSVGVNEFVACRTTGYINNNRSLWVVRFPGSKNGFSAIAGSVIAIGWVYAHPQKLKIQNHSIGLGLSVF